jgi:hypothetical protein
MVEVPLIVKLLVALCLCFAALVYALGTYLRFREGCLRPSQGITFALVFVVLYAAAIAVFLV